MTDTAALTGAFALSTSQYGTVNDSYWAVMAHDICAALGRAGQTCNLVPPIPPHITALVDACLKGSGPPDYVVTFNLMPGLNLGGQSVWELAKLPQTVICLDHPIHLAQQLSALIPPSGMPERWIGIMEKEHSHLLHAIGWPADRIFLCPQGAPPPRSHRKSYRQGEKTGIVFSGTLTYPLPHQDYCDSIGLTPPHLRAALEQAVEQALSTEDDIFILAMRLFGEFGLPAVTLVQLTQQIDRRARLLRRFRVLSSLSDFPITVYGSAEPDVARQLPHCTFHPGVGWSQMQNLMESARIVVNDTINLRDAGLIRLFYPMSLGTVVASDVNRMLRTSFTPQRDFIAVGDDRSETKATVEQVLHDDTFAQTMADNALTIFTKGHQWDSHISGLLTALASIQRNRAL